jgi:hypothetical protein
MTDPTQRFTGRVENYARLMREAERIFRAHETNEKVTFDYDTKVYYGCLTVA